MSTPVKTAVSLLSVLIFVCFVITGLGGYVRLTGSGLSIPEWPFHTVEVTYHDDGTKTKKRQIMPPRTDSGWETLRETFVREVPGFQEGIALHEFKRMFWIEWSHRAVAGFIGLLYLGTLIFVLTKPALRGSIGVHLSVGFFLLIGQAILGAVVVFFHLMEVKVALHLVTAFIFTGLLVWCLMKLVHPPLPGAERRGKKNPILPLALIVFGLTLLQIFSGGLMAASHAGYQWNTWPLMGESLVPANMWDGNWNFYRNMTENTVVIQFTHRWFAFVVVAAVLFLVARAITVKVTPVARWSLRVLFALVVVQVIVGIYTLLMGVHPHLAIMHQVLGLALLMNVLLIVYETAAHKVIAEEELAELAEKNGPSAKEALHA